MNELYYIPIALGAAAYLVTAMRYATHLNQRDGDLDPFSWVMAVIVFPIAYLVTHDERKYDGFELIPKKPKPPSQWELEQKRMDEDERAAAFQVEQLKRRNKHRATMDQHARELARVQDEEDARLAKEFPT